MYDLKFQVKISLIDIVNKNLRAQGGKPPFSQLDLILYKLQDAFYRF